MKDRATMPPECPAPLPLRVCVRSFPGRADQVGNARALVARFLSGCPAAGDAVLLVSELAANACAHSASGRPGGTFTVRAQVSEGGRVYAEVEDEGSSWDGTFGNAKSPHGLYLLRALAAECGTRRGDRGWITWFVLGQPRPLSPVSDVSPVWRGSIPAAARFQPGQAQQEQQHPCADDRPDKADGVEAVHVPGNCHSLPT